MTLGSSELQTVLYSVLTSALPNTPVYDYVPETADTPYVVIGEDDITNIGGKLEPIYEITVSISVFSSYNGMKEVKELSSDIIDAVREIDTVNSDLYLRYLRLENIEHSKISDDMRKAELLVVFTVS
jgi:hypothetical protein